MKGAVDSLGRTTQAEIMSRKTIAMQDKVIQLKGPDEMKRLLAPGSAKSIDSHNKYWEKVEQEGVKTAPNAEAAKRQPMLVAQTRYLPVNPEDWDDVQRQQQGLPPRKDGRLGPPKKRTPLRGALDLEGDDQKEEEVRKEE